PAAGPRSAGRVDRLPVDVDAQPGPPGRVNVAFAVDLRRLDQAEAAVAARAQLEVLAVRDRAGDVQVRQVEHRVERHVDLALQAEGLGQGGGLLQTGHPALPRDVAADDVDRVPGDVLAGGREPGEPIAAPLGADDRHIELPCELAVG